MKICFPVTARPHLARQKLLVDELKKFFEVEIFQPNDRKGNMSVSAILYAVEFNNYLVDKNYDAIIIRGDRYEMLPLAAIAVYKGFKIIHIEGGDESGVIDNKIRHAITQLSDYHFCTNEESHKRIINMGISPERVWNFGSLDVEFANKIKPRKLKEKPYILVTYHAIEGEDEKELDKALFYFKNYNIIKIKGNSDYGKQYGEEEYSPEDYINLIRFAETCVGNSSSLLKEASILGAGVVNVGNRQDKRLKPKNVIDVPCEKNKIKLGIEFQLKNHHKKDLIYYKPNTSKQICRKIKQVLQDQ